MERARRLDPEHVKAIGEVRLLASVPSALWILESGIETVQGTG